MTETLNELEREWRTRAQHIRHRLTNKDTNDPYADALDWKEAALWDRAAHALSSALAGIARQSDENTELLMEQLKAHWFTQGGTAEFGGVEVENTRNADEFISAVLSHVRGKAAGSLPSSVCFQDHICGLSGLGVYCPACAVVRENRATEKGKQEK